MQVLKILKLADDLLWTQALEKPDLDDTSSDNSYAQRDAYTRLLDQEAIVEEMGRLQHQGMAVVS